MKLVQVSEWRFEKKQKNEAHGSGEVRIRAVR